MTPRTETDPGQHNARLLTYALEYAERGWPIFPCFGIGSDGHCTCREGPACGRPGKHPRISNGRNGATTDVATIEAWWSRWPDSNIAIATGKESGIVVIDVDSEQAAAHVHERGVPTTLEQRTGSGGTHLVFVRPAGNGRFRTATTVGGVSGLDSRADGGYIIAPPSRHISGGYYDWVAGVDPVECPQWWADLIHGAAPDAGPVEVPTWNPDGELPENIVEILEYIPADEYGEWRDVGMALHHADPTEDGFRVWDWWSSTSDRYDPRGVRKEWKNFSRRGHQVENPITLASIRRRAEELGWTDPATEHGASVWEQLQASAQIRITERLQSIAVRLPEPPDPPGHLTPENGLIGEIARWIDATSIRPQPRLSLAAALAFVSTLAGRRYASPTNLRTNLYIVGLAPTGAGKNHARTCIHRLATWAGCDDFLGADHIASGSAIVNSLKGQPVKLYLLDEFGLLLQSITNPQAGGHRREIITRLVELYSLSQSSYRGIEYADADARPRKIIHNPHVCVYGTSTGSTFWAALSGTHVLDGTLNRLLIVDTGEEVPERRRGVVVGDPPAHIIQQVKDLVTADPDGRRGNLSGRGGHRIGERAHTVPMHRSVEDAEYEFAKEMDRVADTEMGRAIYSRVSENAIKLALTHAISLDPYSPWIGPESWEWGRDVALWCANTLMHHARLRVSNSEAEAHQQLVYDVIASGGESGVSKTDLWRRTRRLRKREREEAIEALEFAEVIAAMRVPPADGIGRPALRYVVLDGRYFEV